MRSNTYSLALLEQVLYNRDTETVQDPLLDQLDKDLHHQVPSLRTECDPPAPNQSQIPL